MKGAYDEQKRILYARVNEYLDGLPQKEKEERLLIAFTPTIPEDEDVRQCFVDDAIHPFETDEAHTNVDLRTELVQRIEYLDIEININLSLKELQSELRRHLEAMTEKEKLKVGLYGKPTTSQDIEWIRETQIDGLLMHLPLTALNMPIEVLKKTLATVDMEYISKQTKGMRACLLNTFPGVIQTERIGNFMQEMGFFDSRCKNVLKSLKIS